MRAHLLPPRCAARAPPRGRARRARGAQAPPGAQAAFAAAARPLLLRAPVPGGLRTPWASAGRSRPGGPEDAALWSPQHGPAARPPARAHSAASPFPRPAQARGLGIKRAARAAGPPGAPRTLTASSAGRRRGALGAAGRGGAGRRGPAWAAPLPPPIANADLKPGERAEALRPLRARRPGPRRGCVSHPSWGEGPRTDPAPPEDGEGQEAGHGPCAASINNNVIRF